MISRSCPDLKRNWATALADAGASEAQVADPAAAALAVAALADRAEDRAGGREVPVGPAVREALVLADRAVDPAAVRDAADSGIAAAVSQTPAATRSPGNWSRSNSRR